MARHHKVYDVSRFVFVEKRQISCLLFDLGINPVTFNFRDKVNYKTIVNADATSVLLAERALFGTRINSIELPDFVLKGIPSA
jgi:hypothetical protein